MILMHKEGYLRLLLIDTGVGCHGHDLFVASASHRTDQGDVPSVVPIDPNWTFQLFMKTRKR
jgi:hypothetical protein